MEEAFWKAVAVILLTIVFGTALGKTEKDISVVLTIAACCIVMVIAMQYLSDVVAFLWQLGNWSGYQNPFLGTLLKISGVALTTELTGLIGLDAGNSALGKAIQILGNAVILFLSLPLFESFFTMVQEIMGIV